MKSIYNIGSISLWGRSMGAVTAILYAEKYHKTISSMILDSPFHDIEGVVREVANKKFNLPNIVISMGNTVILTCRLKVLYLANFLI